MKKLAWYALLGLQLVVILGFWSWNHIHHPMGNQLTGESTGQFLAYGRLAGLLAAYAILLQLFLISRVRWVEQTFGFDRLMRLHHVVGFAIVGSLIAHPVLLTIGHARQADAGLWAQFVDFCRTWDDVLPAVIGLAIMLAAIAFSALVVLKRLRYEIWYATHLTLYLAIALAFGHQLAVGSDFTDNRWFRIYWWLLYAFVFGHLLYYRVARPLWSFARRRFVVARVVPEASDVTSVYIEGRHLDSLRAEAGQFVIVRFLAPGFRWEAHPFSLSRRPDGKSLRLTIKQLGDYTRRIPQLQPGTAVIVDGPHGVFTARHGHSDKVLLIAGGIGITPIRSLAEELAVAGRDVVLLYGNRNREGTVFAQELDDLAAASAGRLRVVYVMSDDANWDGERGRLDRERMARLVPDVAEREVYLCGPPVMMKSVRSALASLGVPRRRVHDERFAL